MKTMSRLYVLPPGLSWRRIDLVRNLLLFLRLPPIPLRETTTTTTTTKMTTPKTPPSSTKTTKSNPTIIKKPRNHPASPSAESAKAKPMSNGASSPRHSNVLITATKCPPPPLQQLAPPHPQHPRPLPLPHPNPNPHHTSTPPLGFPCARTSPRGLPPPPLLLFDALHFPTPSPLPLGGIMNSLY